MISFAMQMKDAKNLFFDRPAVQAMMSRKERKVLSKFGAFTRQRAKSSIKQSAKNQSSQPGEASRGHTGGLKQNIFFSADPGRRSVVIGPTAFKGRTGQELEALEFGGETIIHDRHKGLLQSNRRATIKARPTMTLAFQAEQRNLASLLSSIR